MTKYRASKLTVKHVDNATERAFLNANHKQGWASSEIALGLFDDETLVQIETFGFCRIERQNKHNLHEYELIRECSRKDCIVYGGKSRLLKHFVAEYNPASLLSYCSLTEGFDGHSYAACGFSLLKEDSSYHWEYTNKNGETIKLLRYATQKNSRLRSLGEKEPIARTFEKLGLEYRPQETEKQNCERVGIKYVKDLGNQVWEKTFAKNIGYIYDMEYKGKHYRGQHTVVKNGEYNRKPYHGSGVKWNEHLGKHAPTTIKILEWISDNNSVEYAKKINEAETKYITEIYGLPEYLNVAEGPCGNVFALCNSPEAVVKRRETWKNKSPMEKLLLKEKKSKVAANMWATMSEETKYLRNEKISATYQNKTQEEKKEIIKKISKSNIETKSNMSKEQKDAIVTKWKENWENKTQEEKDLRRQKQQETRNNWTEEYKAEYKKRMSDSVKKYFKNNQERWKETVKKQQETRNNWTEEYKAEYKKRMSESCKKSMKKVQAAYKDYKKEHPEITWNEFQKIYKR